MQSKAGNDQTIEENRVETDDFVPNSQLKFNNVKKTSTFDSNAYQGGKQVIPIVEYETNNPK
jgi:hypothetical protein